MPNPEFGPHPGPEEKKRTLAVPEEPSNPWEAPADTVDRSAETMQDSDSFESASEKEIRSRYERAVNWLSNNYEMLKKMSRDPVVQEGVVPAIRTFLNVIVVYGEVVPGGEVLSLAADGAKAVDEVQLKAQRLLTKLTGIETSGKRLPINITPEASFLLATLTEAAEPFTLGLAPSHAAEASVQASFDLPRVYRAGRRLVEIHRAHSRVSPQEQQALDMFNA